MRSDRVIRAIGARWQKGRRKGVPWICGTPAAVVFQALLIGSALCAGSARADQYRSEVRVLDEVPAPAAPQTPQALLQSAQTPYAKALILRDLAAQAAQKGDAAAAARYLEQAIAQNALSGPAAEQLRQQLAQVYMSSGDYQKLIPQLEQQTRAADASVESLMALGSAYLAQKKYAQAVPLLQRGMARAQQQKRAIDPSWRRALAAALLALGRDAEALPELEKLLAEDPSQRDDWLRLAAIALKSGDKARAAAVFELAGRLGFLQTPAERLQLVTLTAQIGAPFVAASTLTEFIQRKQVADDGASAHLLATLWVAARESSLALPALEKAIASKPSAPLYQQLAQLHMDREEYAQAAKALESAVALGARDAATLMTLGLARYQQADIDAALTAFAQARALGASGRLAGEWIRYLESGRAREMALAEAANRRERSDEPIQLGSQLGTLITLDGQASSQAAVDAARAQAEQQAAQQAAQVPRLTAIGADANANADGRIPAYSGGIRRSDWPAGFRPGQRLKNPYASDQPLFTITAANMAQYKQNLSPGHQALLARYPSYKLPVYTTRRSVAYPQAIEQASQDNRTRAQLLNPDALSGARLGVPFIQPRTGAEIMWNHRTRYRGDTVEIQTTQAVVAPNKKPHLLKQTERVYFRYGNIREPLEPEQKNILLYYLTWFGETRHATDFLALVHESLNGDQTPRALWVLLTKIGRMLRIPPVGYDQPFIGAEGLMFIDMVDMYNGNFDRYVWKLAGKRELYIPYNSFAIADGHYKYADLLTPRHFNQAATRYELHRVWVIEATERQGKKHSFGKRTFYVDEDSWNIVLVENEDRSGNLWRFQEGHLLPQYDIQAANTAPMLVYDLKDGRYFASRLSSEDVPPQYGIPMRSSEFLPAAVKARYSR
ncbi:DUF1329 domain-containing protein [Sinimarinibacterium sp. NLF-5-8]|uniref:DUF1329 domain-containing protein n=1 Tax=Sinimarinibacterium sp. NLF-5-8 TaxID=2698684 RepID=UPI00137C2323|nr:DUF1329 domain-containing protein [Sinimarinibacterium sp. NLF-5-8]QHS09576.1 DUF1329 domain-containing protein [Sinimarinibacterium sp. NLF-5-8]